jgi:hypothetical protein
VVEGEWRVDVLCGGWRQVGAKIGGGYGAHFGANLKGCEGGGGYALLVPKGKGEGGGYVVVFCNDLLYF